MASKLPCILCRTGPRDLPDRNVMSPIKKVCRLCHSDRLRGDLDAILKRRADREHNSE